MAISNPKVNIQILSANIESLENEEQKILFIGQKNGGTATAGELYEDAPDGTADILGLFGVSSIMSEMLVSAKKYNKITKMDAIPLDDHGSGTPATGSVTVTGTATENATVYVIAGSSINHKIAVSITSGDVQNDIATKIETAVLTDQLAPVTPSAATNVVTMTANNAGLEGNYITLKVEGTVGGVTFAVAAMSGGATNPVLTNVLDVVEDLRYQTIVFPRTYVTDDTGNNIVTFLNARWNPGGDRILDGVGITAITDTYANLASAYISDAQNSQNFIFIPNRKVDTSLYRGSALLELDYAIAAQVAAVRALRLSEDAPLASIIVATQGAKDAYGGMHISTLPYHNTPLEYLPVIDIEQSWTDAEKSTFDDIGWAVIGNNVANNEIIMGAMRTRYIEDAQGDEDLSYKYLNYVDQSSVSREYYHNNLREVFNQTRLTLGDIPPGYSVANESIIKAEIMKLYGELADMSIMISGEAARKKFLDNLTISIDEMEGTVTITMLDLVVTQLRQIDVTMQLTFSLNS